MATMNISLPEPMKRWVEAQTAEGRFSNLSDYVRALIRREQAREDKIAHRNRLVEEAEASGISEHTMDEIWQEALRRAGRQAKAA